MHISDFFDSLGNLIIGARGRSTTARISIDPRADDTAGIAIDVAPTRASAARKAGIKLGSFTLTQDTAGDGTINIGIVDANGVVVASWTAGTVGTNANTYVKYLDAIATAADYHMKVDTSLVSLAAIDGTNPSDAVAWARANAIQAAFAAHFASVGSRTTDGSHKAAETTVATTLAAVPAATSTGSMCTLAIALGAAFIAHGNSSGVHFHDDSAAVAYTPTSDLLAGNATKGKAVTELDSILAAAKTHFAAGVS